MSLATTVRQAAVAAAAVLTISSATASDYVETEALFHARAIQEAFDALAEHITDGSSAAVSWTGTTPPAATGWLADWTARGLGALYCDNVLLVHAVRVSMKGVGTNLAAVQLAPHLEAKARNRDIPPLHWLDGGTAEGVLGRGDVALPTCMGTTPSDRPALAGTVVDPFTVTTNQVTFEHQARACGSGFHGTGQTWVREVTQELNGRDEPTGTPTTGSWSLLVDHCQADTVTWEYFRQSCTFTPGPPHVGTLTGDAVWRRQKSVTASGTSYGAPEFVSTTCWTDPNPLPPTPTEWTSTTSETRSVSCGAGYTGSRTQRRTLTWRHLKWPWDASATVQRVSQTNWATSSNTCRLIPPPQCPAGQVGTPPNCVTPSPQQCPSGQVGTPPNCVTPTTQQQCPSGQTGTPPNCVTPTTTTTESDDDDDGNNGNSGGDGGNIGGGWDTDGDGKADVADLSDVDEADRPNANYVSGHTPIGQDNTAPTSPSRPSSNMNRGGNQNTGGGGDRDSGPSEGGGPGGQKGSGDRGR